MGWYFTYGAYRRDIIREIVEESCHPADSTHGECLVLAHCCRGNVLWTVHDLPAGEGRQRYIGCFLLQRGTGDGWGYKPMDEGMGPFYYTCPLSYILLAGPTTHHGTLEWRRKVVEHHVEAARDCRFTTGRGVEMLEKIQEQFAADEIAIAAAEAGTAMKEAS